MSSKPRPWPNIARAARDESAMQAIRGIRAIRPLVEGSQCNREETLRRQAIALDALQTIARLMAEAGAATRQREL